MEGVTFIAEFDKEFVVFNRLADEGNALWPLLR